MEYTINVAIDEQNLYTPEILSVNGTVDIIRCNFSYDSTWDNFPARQAIFESKGLRKSYVASIADDSCIIPWEALAKEGDVRIALVGTNTDGQVQRTETKTIVKQVSTLQGGVNSITPTPDQYAQFIAEVEEMIGEAGVLSVNGMTGVVTLTASDVDALPDTTVIPTKTSDLDNDSGFLTSVPVSSVNSKTGAVVLSASDVGALPSNTTFVSSVNGSSGAVTINIPTKTSDLNNDSGFLTSAVTSFNGNTGAVTYTAPVSSVNSKTGAVTLAASDVGALADTTTYVSSVNGSSGAVTISTATTSSNGLMSSTDKSHLDSVYADYSSALQALGVI